ncbi:cytochrome P450 1A4-like [Cygnus olor]|uniref:cytochrome P450 1A4-like n=1 Tax=Cygnus olor TaxID=8869 RepID=UPI001ADE51F0|nr:cytochrome P450 1A4-like [Cygnus olor]
MHIKQGRRGARYLAAGSGPRRSAAPRGSSMAAGMEAAMGLAGSPGGVSATEVLLAATVFCLLLLLAQPLRRRVPKGLKPPPGPRGLPVVGNALELRKDPHLALTRLSQKYGDVMEVAIGTQPVLVLSGLDTLRQALVRQGEDFMGRPDLPSFKYISNGQSLAFSPDAGDVWKARRRLAQNALKTFSIAASPTSSSSCLLEEHVSKEAAYLVTKFLQLMEEEQSFDPYRYLVVSVANVICAMCFGKRYDHNDQELLSLVNDSNEFGDVAAAGNPSDFIPLLRYLPSRTMDLFKDINRRFNLFIEKIVQDHYATFNKEHIRDITDSLIGHCQERKTTGEDTHIQLSDQSIIAIVNDLFGAGFDTVTTALSWCLMYAAFYPDIQKKIQDELDQTIGRERRPRLSDRGTLPYTEAFILEMFRHSSFLPFTIPHRTTKATALNGYYIPKDTCVFVNQWQVNHDEKLWQDPSAFKPERFLNAAGTEINRTESDKVLTFGLGRRRCIGESIGRWEVFLFLTTLLQQLEFSLAPGEAVDITPQYGLTMKYKKCERFQIKRRFLSNGSP